MSKRIALFKNTVEVSTAGFVFHLGSMLAQGSHCVLMVDADPMCNLTSLVIDVKGETNLEAFYLREPARNIYAGLSPIFEQHPRTIFPIECLPITARNDLFLLPGNVRLVEYEACLERCQNHPGMEQPSCYDAWALSHLIDVTAVHHNADFVLIDMSASSGILNRDILMTSDFFMIMATPGLSGLALDMIPSVFARWHAWYEKSKDNLTFQPTTYPCTDRLPKFLGMIIQELCPRDSVHAESIQNGTEIIAQKVRDCLIPAFGKLGMVIPDARYSEIEGLYPNLFIDQLPEITKRILKIKEDSDPHRGIDS